MAKKKRFDELHDPTPATHGDLNIWGNQIVKLLEEKSDKKDVQALQGQATNMQGQLNRVETKIDKLFDHIDKRIDHYVENRASDLLGVKHDEVREVQRKVKNHEQRITALEQ